MVQIMVSRAVRLLMSGSRDAPKGSPHAGCLTAPHAQGCAPMHIVTGSVFVGYLYLCFMVQETMQGEGVLCCHAPCGDQSWCGLVPLFFPSRSLWSSLPQTSALSRGHTISLGFQDDPVALWCPRDQWMAKHMGLGDLVRWGDAWPAHLTQDTDVRTV